MKKILYKFFLKEEEGKIFYQGKLKQSPLLPMPHKNYMMAKQVKSVSYKTPALKLQNFFGYYAMNFCKKIIFI